MSDVTDRENAKKTILAVDYVNESWKDGHRGWIICLAAAVVQFVVLGIHNSFGILYIAFVREYGWSKALTGRVEPFSSLVPAETENVSLFVEFMPPAQGVNCTTQCGKRYTLEAFILLGFGNFQLGSFRLSEMRNRYTQVFCLDLLASLALVTISF